MINNNLEKGIPWRFGPDWSGQRCGAKTRRGTACQKPPLAGKTKCRLHGGLSTGPRTPEGKARIAALRTGSTVGGQRASQRPASRYGRTYAQLRQGCALTGLFDTNAI